MMLVCRLWRQSNCTAPWKKLVHDKKHLPQCRRTCASLYPYCRSWPPPRVMTCPSTCTLMMPRSWAAGEWRGLVRAQGDSVDSVRVELLVESPLPAACGCSPWPAHSESSQAQHSQL